MRSPTLHPHGCPMAAKGCSSFFFFFIIIYPGILRPGVYSGLLHWHLFSYNKALDLPLVSVASSDWPQPPQRNVVSHSLVSETGCALIITTYKIKTVLTSINSCFRSAINFVIIHIGIYNFMFSALLK